ncbi:MAG: Protein TolB [Verrucomicrobiales bacterium]|nr:Protein TolB [Verrucomicrobiales bacterium]
MKTTHCNAGSWAFLLGLLLTCMLPANTFAGQAPEIQWCSAGQASSINSTAFSPDGQTFASGAGDNTVKLWRTSDGNLLHTLPVPKPSTTSPRLAFSAAGDKLVSLGFNLACLWSVQDGTLLKTITNSIGGSFIAATSDASMVAGAFTNLISIYNTSSGSLLRVLTNQTGNIQFAAFSPDGTKLATSDATHTITFWNVANGSLLNSWTSLSAGFIIFSPDGQALLLGGGGGQGYFRLHRVTDGQSLWTNSPSVQGNAYAGTFSPNGQIVASGASSSGGSDVAIRLWRTSDGTLLRSMQMTDYQANTLCFSPDNATLAAGGRISNAGVTDTVIRFWNVTNGTLARTLTGHYAAVTSTAFSPDGTLLASGGNGTDRTVRLWRSSDGAPLYILNGLYGDITGVAFAPDSLTVIGCDNYTSATIHSWNVTNGTQAWQVSVYPWSSFALAGSLTSNLFAAAESYYGFTNPTRIELRKFSDGQLVQTISNFPSRVKAVSFSPNGTLLASGCYDGTIKLWQVPTTNLVRNINVGSEVLSVAFSPDGTLLASGASNSLVKIWRVSDGALQTTLTGHSGSISGVAFSPDGGNLASSSSDGTLRIWRVANGALLATYDNEMLSPLCLAPNLRERMFAFGRADATLVVSRWPTPQLQSFSTLTNGAIKFQLNALTGQVYTIEATTNLQNWNDWTQVTPTNSSTLISDPVTNQLKFYRVKLQ